MARKGRWKENPTRRSRQHRKRRTRGREDRQRFLIVCEGQETEPQYFRRFRVPGHVQGFGISPSQLVNKALEMKTQDEYDHVWCVFDRDNWGAGEFNGAIQRAVSQGIRVAYSNQAFELWYLLHFHFYQTPMPRKEYQGKLSQLLGYRYRKNATDLYDQLAAKQELAITHAEKLLAQYSLHNPANEDPSTTVHRLVIELNNS